MIKPHIEVAYEEPKLPDSSVRSQDDVQNTMEGLGFGRQKHYIGSVTFAGIAGAIFPPRWTVSKVGSGVYTIVHNLNSVNYVIMVMTILHTAVSDTVIYTAHPKNLNDVTINIANSTNGVTVNTDFDFMLLLQR